MAWRDEPAPQVPLPMFPLGTVLFPKMPLPLHIFEPRYRAMTRDCLRSGRRFGVVLIERGSEVGGGDSRYGVGTVARIAAEAELPDGRWALVTTGENRIRISTWLPDDPYPLALVESMDRQDWTAQGPSLTDCERAVRRCLGMAAELDLAGEIEIRAPATFELHSDPEVAGWQLCHIAPLGAADRQRLLEAPDPERLGLLSQLVEAMSDLFAYRLGGR
jgi:Lon protease-like protein